MKLKKVKINNYRLLTGVEIDVDDDITLIVGKNNSGKTSFMDFLNKIFSGGKISFDDYPIIYRADLYDSIIALLKKEFSYEEFCYQIKVPSIRLIVDYSMEKNKDDLGYLSEFIIDIDSSISEAIIEISYDINISEELFISAFEKVNLSNDIYCIKSELRKILNNSYSEMLKIKIKAVNPANEKDFVYKSIENLKNLFPICNIRAERAMDESEVKNYNTLNLMLTKLFTDDLDESTKDLEKNIQSLRDLVSITNIDAQNKVNGLLSNIVSNAIGFGYPSIDDLQLLAETKMQLEQQIVKNTSLTYVDNKMNESLPSNYNGLGYKNLIKIEMQLAYFAREIKDSRSSTLPILFIEEPESHMHPQLQQKFISYITEYLRKLCDNKIQVIITTHSSHISSSVPFSKIRYVQRQKNGVNYKNLNYFANKEKSNYEFLQKYLNITKCDMFFADKIILIEGSSEKLLLPDMINKCAKEKIFSKNSIPSLESQYCSILEVGGAYGHKFIPFIEYLGIPTLIITDLDPVKVIKKGDKKVYQKSNVEEGNTTSNATIKYWVTAIDTKKNKNSKSKGKKSDSKDKAISLNELLKFTETDKSFKNWHIAYQVLEDGICGRSLEESIINCNRKLFKIGDNPTEKDIAFESDKIKKTDFAIDLLTKQYDVPSYIKQGLIWLDKQRLYVGDDCDKK